MILLDLLVSQDKIDYTSAQEIEKIFDDHPETILDEELKKRKVDMETLIQARSTLYGIPIFKENIKVDNSLNKFISIAQSKQLLAIPLEIKEGVLLVGVVDPGHNNVLDALQFMLSQTGQAYKLYLITYNQFQTRIKNKDWIDKDEEFLEKDAGAEFSVPEKEKINTKDSDEKVEVEEFIDLSDEDDVLDDNLIKREPAKIFNAVLRQAIEQSASDIHIEHLDTSVRTRFRVDGTLKTVLSLPPTMHSTFIARIKILCSMKLDEKRKPQDGRFSTKLEGRNIDYRVSTFPGYYGEKVVIRILDSYKGVKPLEDLGFSKENISRIRDALAQPYGIILISGPTGSGKTTTLYSMINEIDRDKRNVVSLEDPVEYNIPSMNQSQIFPEIGYTFASGLRSILRQDPDVIMVGEIRDAETAALAIQASLTGHLVFSTIHTNTATGVITRLLDMGIEPYLIAPTLTMAIGQRLVRQIAEGGAKKMEMDIGMRKMVEEQFKDLPDEYKEDLPLNSDFNEAVPTAKSPTGTKGRLAVFEVLVVDNEIEGAIVNKKGEKEIWEIARKKGMISIKEDTILKCMQGLVPFTEIESL